MRKLVTVRTVSEIRPIAGADKIELAIIDGWQCVVKKGEFQTGQQGLYFEVDSFLPATDERFKFLEKNFTLWRNRYGARIKTIRLRGELSQGLLLPLSDFPEVRPHKWGDKDFSEEVKVVKWEREHEAKVQTKATWLSKKLKRFKHTKLKPIILWLEKTFPGWFLTNATRPFPSFIPKTDEERVQNRVNKFSDSDRAALWETTVKLDGSSTTAYKCNGKVGVCSRNLDLKRDLDNKYWATVENTGLAEALKKYPKNIAVQGELMGPGIQGNREKLRDYQLYVYNVYLIDEKRYAGKQERVLILAELFSLGYHRVALVPDLGDRTLGDFSNVDDFLKFSEGPSLNVPTREGVVFAKLDGTDSFKVISNSYLMKEGEQEITEEENDTSTVD